MRRIAAGLVLLGALVAAQEAPKSQSCVTHCHGEQAMAFGDCVHKGEVGCVDCHGGDPTAERDKARSHSPAAGFTGKLTRDKIPGLCAGCHSDPIGMHAYGIPTDQYTQYETSAHGKALLEKGDTRVAICTDCHGTHRILPAHDPRAPTARENQPDTCGRCHSDEERMKPHGLPWDSVDRFKSSVHGRGLLHDGERGAPTCSDCHGSHGATPPGTRNTLQVCANCHLETAEQYRKSLHHASPEMHCRGCHEEDDPRFHRSDCSACHDSHAIRTPGPDMYQGEEPGHCGHCHRGEPEKLAFAEEIVRGIADVEAALRHTEEEIEEAKRYGVFIEDEQIYLRDSRLTLVSVRPLTHSLDLGAVRAHLQEGLSRKDRAHETITKRKTALRDRKLLLGTLAGILALLAVLIGAKLRAIRELS